MARDRRPVLLLGASGQLGRELQPKLAALGAVVAPGRDRLDLADADAVRRAVRELDPALIVNAAAWTAVDAAETAEAEATAVNAVAPGVLAEAVRQAGGGIVHVSTDYVFGDPPRAARPWRETDTPGPLNAYGRTKLAGERAVADAGGAWLVLRTGWLYSRHGRNFVTTIRRLARERAVLKVVDDQTGSPTWAGAVAGAIAAMLRQTWDTGGAGALAERAGLYHLSAAGATTWHGFAQHILDRLPDPGAGEIGALKAVSSAEYGAAARRPRYSVLDNSRVRETFGIDLPDWERQYAAFCVSEA